jgi:hypothetical protein
MPMLLWLPIIFASALFQIAASPSTPEVDDMTKRPDGTHEYGSDDEANLKAQMQIKNKSSSRCAHNSRTCTNKWIDGKAEPTGSALRRPFSRDIGPQHADTNR